MAGESGEPDGLEQALLRRIEEAVKAARRICAESKALVGFSASLRESRLTTRCAWCGRYRFAERWLVVEDPPGFADVEGVSHGICDDCVAELRSAGLSA